MSSPLHIRRAGKEDAPEIARIHVAAIRNAYSGIYTPEYLAGLSADERAARWTEAGKGHLARTDPTLAVFVAFSNNRLVGFADIGPVEQSPSSDCAELFAIYLDPAHIGKGVGRALFCACVDHAKAHGFKSMTARVLSRNSRARTFYERMQGQPMPSTEKVEAAGGSEQNVISYRWPNLPALSFENFTKS